MSKVSRSHGKYKTLQYRFILKTSNFPQNGSNSNIFINDVIVLLLILAILVSVMVYHCGFNMNFLMINVLEHLFYVIIGHQYILLVNQGFMEKLFTPELKHHSHSRFLDIYTHLPTCNRGFRI